MLYVKISFSAAQFLSQNKGITVGVMLLVLHNTDKNKFCENPIRVKLHRQYPTRNY